MIAPSTQNSRRDLIVCASHRTGSNLLDQMLKASLKVGRPREYYSPKLSVELAQKYGFPSPKDDLLGYHKAITSKFVTSNGVFGVKVMWNHLEALRAQLYPETRTLGVDTTGPRPDEWKVLSELHPDTMVVWVRREDKVRQAISMFRAKQTGIFSSPQLERGKRAADTQLAYDYAGIRTQVDKFTMEEASWQRVFDANGIKPVVVDFTQIVANPQETALSIIRSFGLGEPTDWETVPIPNKKVSDALNDQWFDQYHQDLPKHDEFMAAALQARHRARKAAKRQKFFNFFNRLFGRGTKATAWVEVLGERV